MKKLSILLLICLLLFSLSGCQLARTDIETTGDLLVGVLVTSEYLDLFDMESYLNDNLSKIGPDMVINGDTSAYQGRIYATLIPGSSAESDQITFHDLKGLHLIAAKRQDENGETYNRVYTSDGIVGGKTAYHYGDTEESVSVEAEIWMAHRTGDLTTYINPVYQDSKGNFYVTSGRGFSTNGNNAPGVAYTQTMEDSRTTTTDGVSMTNSVSISISIGSMYETKQYTLIQMSKDNTILSSEVFLPGDMPEELTIAEETAYILLENHQVNHEFSRKLYERDTDMMITYYANEDGFMVEDFTVLNWK